MFATFTATSPTAEQSPKQTATPASSGRPKRQQVSRACIWCRTQRIKCDAHFPCTNCRTRGRKCSNGHTHGKNSEEIRTYPLAIKEIEKLRLRVKELERQLSNASVTDGANSGRDSNHPLPSSLPLNLDPLEEHGGNKKFYNWDFVRTQTSQSDDQCYGYSSSVYFTHQITRYLKSTLQHGHPGIPQVFGNRRLSRFISIGRNDQARDSTRPFCQEDCTVLSQCQEEQLIETYFTSYQTVMPILDEIEFKTSHKCLWETLDSYRKPSALVDIVLALAMQYSGDSSSCHSQCLLDNNSEIENNPVAGQLFYRRCCALLADEQETPSIQTFQSHLLSALWLLNASSWNMAYSVLAMGIRTGIILGLHLEPHGDLNASQREFRRCLWWAMYSLEIRLAMDLGRPLAVSISMVTANLPKHSLAQLDSSRAQAPHHHIVEKSSYLVHYIRLILAARATYITFYDKCAEVLSQGPHKSLYHDYSVLETCAEFLTSKVAYVKSWLADAPSILKTARKYGKTFSIDDSALDFDPTVPTWISQQRIFLELEYHDLLMILYRPFIHFTHMDNKSGPLSVAHATSCVNHAIRMTSIIFQTISETNYLNGYHRVFSWQWNAFLSLIGYILTFPAGLQTPSARRAVSTAIKTLELLPNHLEGAFTAADIARDLSAKADLLIERFRNSFSSGHTTSSLQVILPFNQSENVQLDNLLTTTESTLSGSFQEEELSLLQHMPTSYSDSTLTFDILAGLGIPSGDTTNGFDLSIPGNTDATQ
ncbi:hypothetical protein DM02DRAFT_620884 [Periconia macrospinosa]|uniref:Zn(2)-C6 fungal-type domain-containing protein n=1 Tax=Periconia macrospinosa TaxID=97972 RepID=A0A2V1CYB1_9PLEO|nr:hypothetical protein DM02DRAFT_620884 [Periconia macrospinosa]